VVEVSRVRQVMRERMVNAQPHDPNMVRLPDGSGGRLQETSTGCKVIEACAHLL
jgi:hypothetical protein